MGEIEDTPTETYQSLQRSKNILPKRDTNVRLVYHGKRKSGLGLHAEWASQVRSSMGNLARKPQKLGLPT